jgi:RNA polymerase sigma factor (sigma-70 family)
VASAVEPAADEGPDDSGDPALIDAVRRGDIQAYGLLYQRHLGIARRFARTLVPLAAERDDLVAEAFTRVLRALRAGHGPTDAFRPYLLATLRNLVISTARRGPGPVLYGHEPETYLSAPADDSSTAHVQIAVATDAFATLPERWRTVLWQTEIEGKTPADLAPLLGMSPNSISALAYRAREALRQAYLQQHQPAATRSDCHTHAAQLAAWVRRGRPRHQMPRITAHLAGCPDCRATAEHLATINTELPGSAAR